MSTSKFPWGRTAIVGFGFLGISIIWPIFNQFIPIFLQAGNKEFEAQLLAEGRKLPQIVGFGLSPALALFIMTWDNIINIFIQPWVGEKSDLTWNRFGRRKSWILLGTPIAALGFIFIPFAQSVLAVMVFILITNFGMALFRSPTIAWLGDLFKPEDRSKANGVINLMGGAGGLLAFLVGGILFNSVGKWAPFVAGAVALVAAMLAAVILVKEPERIEAQAQPQAERRGVLRNFMNVASSPNKNGLFVLVSILFWFMGFNALETGLSSFAVFSLGIDPGMASIYAASVTISFLLCSIPAGLIAGRIGRRQTIQIGLTGLVLLFLAGYFIIQNLVTFVLVLVAAGFFWALVNVNSLPLVYDNGEGDKIGAYTGLYYFSSQLAAVLGPTLGGVVVDLLGDQYRWLFLFSTFFMILAWLTMSRVKDQAKALTP